jgi:hypothetical protein
MREFVDVAGGKWTAEIVSHGRTSGYLNPKVHRPVVQFSCRSTPLPRRYASLPKGRDALEQLDDAELVALLEKSQSH